ncbi:MAG: alpha/beta hydrolase [Actinomycetota bacterium]
MTRRELQVAAAILLVAACFAGCTGDASPKGAAGPSGGASAVPSVLSPRPAPSPSEPVHLPQASIAWKDCDGGFQCGTLTVPLDYEHPVKRKIDLAVIRRRASDPSHRVGSLLLDPGGPGASGVLWLRNIWRLFGGLSQRFDLVAFDPRGVAQSAPVRCLDDADLEDYFQINPVPTSSQEKRAWISANKHYDEACLRNDKELVHHISTQDTAFDMESLRRALGDPKLNYLGFSYGTFMGEMYASLFPKHVRAMALDAVVPPRLTTTGFIQGQARGFAQDLQDFFQWCRTNGCSLSSSGDPEKVLNELVHRLQYHVIPAGETRTLALGQATYGVAEGLYNSDNWPQLSSALSAAAGGNGAPLLTLFDYYAQRDANGHYTNQFDAYNAIVCVDRPSPRSPSRYGQLAKNLQRRYGVFGEFLAWQTLPCAFWPVDPVPLPTGLDSKRLAALLYIGRTHDPATPYSWAKLAQQETRGSVLLTRVGEGHTSYGKSTCVHEAVDAYLIDLKVPPKHKRCEGS